MTNLTPHFTLEELIYSDTANKFKINNIPNDIYLKTLKHTCEYFLEPLRKLLNDKYKIYSNKSVKQVIIKITSGYRCETLNKKVGGSTTSQHKTGEAVDFDVYLLFTDGSKFKLPYTEVYQTIKNFIKNKLITVDQLICERSNSATWVHASYSASGSTKNRNQFLLYINGKYTIVK